MFASEAQKSLNRDLQRERGKESTPREEEEDNSPRPALRPRPKSQRIERISSATLFSVASSSKAAQLAAVSAAIQSIRASPSPSGEEGNAQDDDTATNTSTEEGKADAQERVENGSDSSEQEPMTPKTAADRVKGIPPHVARALSTNSIPKGKRPLTMHMAGTGSSLGDIPIQKSSSNPRVSLHGGYGTGSGPVLDGIDSISDKGERMRLQVINELLSTEKDYVSDLQLMIDVFLSPIRTKELLAKADLEIIFSNLETIRGVNEMLKNDLEKSVFMSLDSDILVGKIFITMSTFLKSYTDYVDRQDGSLQHVDKCKKKYPKFANFLKETEYTPQTRGLSLNSFLIKPMQRITKYPLLIKELLKNTKEDHADYANLVEALSKLEIVANAVNERKRLSENRQKILEITSLVSGISADKIIAPNRRFIMEDDLYKISKGKKQERHFFLFNDLLLYGAKSTGGKINFKGKVELEKTVVNDLPNDNKNLFSFELWRLDNKKKKYVICCSTLAQKKKWMTEMKKGMQQGLEAYTSHSKFSRSKSQVVSTD